MRCISGVWWKPSKVTVASISSTNATIDHDTGSSVEQAGAVRAAGRRRARLGRRRAAQLERREAAEHAERDRERVGRGGARPRRRTASMPSQLEHRIGEQHGPASARGTSFVLPDQLGPGEGEEQQRPPATRPAAPDRPGRAKPARRADRATESARARGTACGSGSTTSQRSPTSAQTNAMPTHHSTQTIDDDEVRIGVRDCRRSRRRGVSTNSRRSRCCAARRRADARRRRTGRRRSRSMLRRNARGEVALRARTRASDDERDARSSPPAPP